jgi:hypothetical protein
MRTEERAASGAIKSVRRSAPDFPEPRPSHSGQFPLLVEGAGAGTGVEAGAVSPGEAVARGGEGCGEAKRSNLFAAETATRERSTSPLQI